MSDTQAVDITELATLGGQFPLRLMQLGFHLMQAIDDQGRDQFRYVLPPVCEVPAGPFLMGSDMERDPDAYDGELPQHEVVLPTFHMCQHPLTVTEFACAMEAGAVSEPDAGDIITWQGQLQRADHPVIGISLFDAMDYAAWLSKVTGSTWRLPTEAEWEKAARGTDGRIYPWGDLWDKARANSEDGGPGMTTAVGSYPQGASPYGVKDMVGNVEEWCSSLPNPYPYRQDDGREISPFAEVVNPDDSDDDDNLGIDIRSDKFRDEERALRGSSWEGSRYDARAAFRNRFHPDINNFTGGVRLVMEAAL